MHSSITFHSGRENTNDFGPLGIFLSYLPARQPVDSPFAPVSRSARFRAPKASILHISSMRAPLCIDKKAVLI